MTSTATQGPRPHVDVTLKLSLAGDPAVGKTSLVRRFVSNTFDEKYVSTLGTKVSSRTFAVEDPGRPGGTLDVGAAIWDIMGSHDFRTLLKEAYFSNAKAVLLVCDRTFPDSLYNLPEWYQEVASVAGPVPAMVLVNKSDLGTPQALSDDEVDRFCKELRWSWLATSAKTGDHVDEAFRRVAIEHLARATNPARPAAAPS